MYNTYDNILSIYYFPNIHKNLCKDLLWHRNVDNFSEKIKNDFCYQQSNETEKSMGLIYSLSLII